jgi:hypothetical protein
MAKLTVLPGIDRHIEIASARPRITANEPGYVNLSYFQAGDGGAVEKVKIKRPVALVSTAPLPEEARRHISKDQLFPHVAFSFRNGAIAASTDPYHATYLHFDGEGRLLDDVGEFSNLVNAPLYSESVMDSFGVRRAHLKAKRQIHVAGAAMPLAFTPTMHLFHSHFLLQCLPRVLILRDLAIDATVLVAPDLRRKQRQMLNMAGIPDHRILPIPEDTLVSADQLIVPQPWPLVFSPYTLKVYEELSRNVTPDADRTRRLLISREQRTSWRNLHTYQAVQDMLVARYGFEVIRPEHLSVEEEIRTYKSADIVIGAEGAGLYSAVFAGVGQTYLAIGDEDYIMPVLGSAATGRGFDVGYVFGESYRADTDVERRLPAGHADFAVDPAAVALLVDKVIALKNSVEISV